MVRLWIVTVMAALGGLIATVGAALTAGAVVGIVGGWVYSALRYAPDWNVGVLPLVLPLQLVVAGWVVRSVLTLDPRPLLRNLLLASGASFLALYGWYFLLGAVLFLSTAVVVGYWAMPVPPGAQTLGRPDQPPLSCQGSKEKIAAFEDSGDMVTPAFETTGYIWGYEFTSVGYGTFSIEILDENGEVVSNHEQPVPAGSGGEYALGSGTFKLEIGADEDLRYAVIVCDETDPSGKSWRRSGEQKGASAKLLSAQSTPADSHCSAQHETAPHGILWLGTSP